MKKVNLNGSHTVGFHLYNVLEMENGLMVSWMLGGERRGSSTREILLTTEQFSVLIVMVGTRIYTCDKRADTHTAPMPYS